MRSITLGQYYPTGSVIHSIDGRMRIILLLLFIVASFVCSGPLSFALLASFTLGLVFLSKVPLKTVLRSVWTIIFILVFTFVINVFFTTGKSEPLFSFWIFTLYREGIFRALFMALRVLSLVIGTSILISYTASPIEITHSLEALLKPLEKIRIPVHSFSMMMFIALRFIPTLSDDTDRIMTAQRARGVDFSKGSLFSRVRSLISVMVPLFVSSFRRADELATAMECRCYHGGEGRTSMRVMRLHASDFVALGIFILFGAAVIALNRFDLGLTL